MQTLTLYELAEERVALDELIAMDEGEWTDEAANLADELAGKLALKADAFGGFVREMEANASAIKEEETRLASRRKSIEGKRDWLMRRALFALQTMGRNRVEGSLFTLAVQKNNPAVTVTVLPGALPKDFVRVIPESYEPDKAALSIALKAGAIIEGATLTRTVSLRIR